MDLLAAREHVAAAEALQAGQREGEEMRLAPAAEVTQATELR